MYFEGKIAFQELSKKEEAMVRAVPQLKYLFNPSSIAVIGASRQTTKWGSIVLSNIIKGGYKGKVYPINPKAEKIQGLKSYPNIKKVPLEIDLSIIATPVVSTRIPEIIEDCAEKNVKMAIVLSSGFGETGKEVEELKKIWFHQQERLILGL